MGCSGCGAAGHESIGASIPGLEVDESQFEVSQLVLVQGTIFAEIITTSSYLAADSPERPLGRVNHGKLSNADFFMEECDSSQTISPAINVQPSWVIR